MVWFLTACILVAAVLPSMLGQGGGALYTPIQTWFGIGFHEAAATSLFLIMVTSLSSSLVYRKAHRIDWPLAIALESVTATGGFLGGLASGHFSGLTLSLAFAGVLVFGAYFMIGSSGAGKPPCSRRRGICGWRRSFGDYTYRVNMVLGLPLSFVAGATSGLLGIGGGILKVPMMVLLLGIPMEVAVGSSALMVGLTAAGGFAGHVVSGHWDWRMSLILAAAVFIGSHVGSRVSVGMDEGRLKAIFAWFLLAIAIVMAATSLRGHTRRETPKPPHLAASRGNRTMPRKSCRKCITMGATRLRLQRYTRAKHAPIAPTVIIPAAPS